MRRYAEGGAALLEEADTPVGGAPSGPVVTSDPLGDTPLTVEVLVEA